MGIEAETRTTAIAPIEFGTDGWRGVIADDFTFENLRRVSRAVAAYIWGHEEPERGVVVGYDTRFGSEAFAQAAAEELARSGLRVLVADDHTPTPALSYAVRHFRAAGGVVITTSHNPWEWNGVKFKAPYGGSASPAITTRIAALLNSPARERPGGGVTRADLRAPYLACLANRVDLKAIAASGVRLAVDPMYGCGRGYLPALFCVYGIPHVELHGARDPLFSGLNPEPIEPHVGGLQRAVVEGGFDAGFALDGDADRLGAVDRTGEFVDSHRIFAILLEYLVGRGLTGEVAKTFSTSKIIDRIAGRHALKLHETPVGFKYICDLMLARDLLIGGEESGGIGLKGHLPERDGILNSLVLAEAMARNGKTLGELVAELHARYGPQVYRRIDLHLEPGQKERALAALSDAPRQVAGFPVVAVQNLDGIKFLLDPDAWVLVRGSGTEPLLRVYAEAPSAEGVNAILGEIEQLIRRARS